LLLKGCYKRKIRISGEKGGLRMENWQENERKGNQLGGVSQQGAIPLRKGGRKKTNT